MKNVEEQTSMNDESQKDSQAPQITNEEIIEIDFYDICGSGSIGMTSAQKIHFYRELTKTSNP